MSKPQIGRTLRLIDAPHYGYWQAIYHAFFNPKLYVDVGKRWKGLSLLYLLLLMFVVSIPLSVRLIIEFNTFYQQQLMMPLKKLPVIYIQKGNASIKKTSPYFIKNKLGEVISIVDTTGSIDTIDKRYPHLAILVTKDKLIYRSPTPPNLFFPLPVKASPIHEVLFDKDTNQIFDGKTWIASSGLKYVYLLADFIIYPLTALLFFVIYLSLFFVFSMMAQLIAKIIFKFNMTYGETFRILVVSATPHIFFLLVVISLQWFFPLLGLVLLSIFAVYFGFAVLSLKRASNKLVIL